MGDHDWVSIGLSATAIAMSCWSLWLTRKAKRLRRQLDRPGPETCQHPTDATRWDEHWSVLRCTACGRRLDGEGQADTPTPEGTGRP